MKIQNHLFINNVLHNKKIDLFYILVTSICNSYDYYKRMNIDEVYIQNCSTEMESVPEFHEHTKKIQKKITKNYIGECKKFDLMCAVGAIDDRNYSREHLIEKVLEKERHRIYNDDY
jgi:hypothetical protein